MGHHLKPLEPQWFEGFYVAQPPSEKAPKEAKKYPQKPQYISQMSVKSPTP